MTHSPEETVSFGRQLAGEIRTPTLVLLEGDLGSGKTTLAKGIVAGLGAAREEDVTSPTFTLVHEYGGERKVYHADLYRIEGAREIATLGLDDLIGEKATVLVEWGERLGADAPKNGLRIRLEHVGERDRRITVELQRG
ncbi:MAG TPA: tRNA (adenosine(37)-N6)-threonylcarbamoyltransferase complex ATPase subunit type 1 TsaE [Terriglobia bacterium]|nr:tRNA (adenosine(37)-N6)-threonylcarbamoyltransferase complex ATPase subunit type 1 TsaE [Terriglobia bacterium]